MKRGLSQTKSSSALFGKTKKIKNKTRPDRKKTKLIKKSHICKLGVILRYINTSTVGTKSSTMNTSCTITILRSMQVPPDTRALPCKTLGSS